MAVIQITKKCEYCGEPFTRKGRNIARIKRQRFCSYRCSTRSTGKTRRISDPAARFWAKVNKDGPIPERRPDLGPCWLWTAGGSYGYGVFNIGRTGNRRIVGAHRWAYEATVGPIPEGLTIDHLCRNRGCVNPSHMEPVTIAENVLRGECISAQRARQTHCIYGHPFDEANTIKTKWGRMCRTCQHEQAVQRWQNILAARRA